MQILNLRSNSDTEEEGKYSDAAVLCTGEEWLQRMKTLCSGLHDIWDMSIVP